MAVSSEEPLVGKPGAKPGSSNAPLIECVANFSEGVDRQVVRELRLAIASAPGILILHDTLDPDHNRSVVTFAAHPDQIVEGALRGVAKAKEKINLNLHSGVHPRVGAADVIPFVPIRDVSMADCVAVANQLADRVWRELSIPVYLYESAARRIERTRLEIVRRGGFEMLRDEAPINPDRAPDIGGPELHPTAGACVIGARKFLIAYNINLNSTDLELARQIAVKIRTSSGGLPCVKALGVMLPSVNVAQVTMNLTDFEVTPIHTVFEIVRREAAKRGVEIADSEIIGLIPQAALENSAEWLPTVKNFSQSMVLENRLHDALSRAKR